MLESLDARADGSREATEPAPALGGQGVPLPVDVTIEQLCPLRSGRSCRSGRSGRSASVPFEPRLGVVEAERVKG